MNWPPIDSAPLSLWPPYTLSPHPGADGHLAALEDALRSVPLGAYDRKVIEHLARGCDTPTVAVLVSLLQRCRINGRDAAESSAS